jgi:hypothetical protein
MPTELQDLNERLKQKARSELRGELKAAATPLENAMRVGCDFETGLQDKEGKRVRAYQAIEMLTEALYQLQIGKREQDAIDAFLERIDGLQAQIDDLTNAASGD